MEIWFTCIFVKKKHGWRIVGRARDEIINQALTKLRTFLRTDVDKKEIKIWYYYDDIEFEKEVSFLKTLLKATKFEKRNWSINPTVGVFHSSL